MEMYIVVTNNQDNAPGFTILHDYEKAKSLYSETEIDEYNNYKNLLKVKEGVEFGYSIASGGDGFYGAEVLEGEIYGENSENESVKGIKTFEQFNNQNTFESKKFTNNDELYELLADDGLNLTFSQIACVIEAMEDEKLDTKDYKAIKKWVKKNWKDIIWIGSKKIEKHRKK